VQGLQVVGEDLPAGVAGLVAVVVNPVVVHDLADQTQRVGARLDVGPPLVDAYGGGHEDLVGIEEVAGARHEVAQQVVLVLPEEQASRSSTCRVSRAIFTHVRQAVVSFLSGTQSRPRSSVRARCSRRRVPDRAGTGTCRSQAGPPLTAARAQQASEASGVSRIGGAGHVDALRDRAAHAHGLRGAESRPASEDSAEL
jgi:hypothetical protein